MSRVSCSLSYVNVKKEGFFSEFPAVLIHWMGFLLDPWELMAISNHLLKCPHGRVLKGAISDTMGWIWSVKNGMERADKKSIEQRSEQIWTVILPLHQPYWNASERGCLINRNTVFANQGFDQSKIASSFKMAQTWYPLVIQHNYGKSPFLIGKSTKNGPFSIAMLVHQRVTSKNGTTFSGRTRPKIGCTIHPLNRDVPSYKSLINNHPPKRITGGGLGKPKRRGTQPHYRMDGESLQKWFWHVFWGKTNRNHVVANMLQTIL